MIAQPKPAHRVGRAPWTLPWPAIQLGCRGCLLLAVLSLFNPAAFGAEPDEGGIGGTGHGTEAQGAADIFERPELPERIERIDLPERPDFVGAPELPSPPGGLGEMPPSLPAAGGAGPAGQ